MRRAGLFSACFRSSGYGSVAGRAGRGGARRGGRRGLGPGASARGCAAVLRTLVRAIYDRSSRRRRHLDVRCVNRREVCRVRCPGCGVVGAEQVP
jgi:hypothetical protein